MLGGRLASYDIEHKNEGIIAKSKDQEFKYGDNPHKPLSKADNERVKEIIAHIPSNYTNIWIPKDPNFKLKYIGTAPNGKKQYFYNTDHIHAADDTKFQRLKYFLSLVPKIKKVLMNDSQEKKNTKNFRASAILRLILLTGMRAGKEEYAQHHQTYGATSLRLKHFQFEPNAEPSAVIIEYVGKKNVPHKHIITDELLIKNLKFISQDKTNPDEPFFDMSIQELNQYIHKNISKHIVIKDFRTYLVNIFLIKKLLQEPIINKRIIYKCIREVAKFIQHKPAVAKTAYIYPGLIDFFLTTKHFNRSLKPIQLLTQIMHSVPDL